MRISGNYCYNIVRSIDGDPSLSDLHFTTNDKKRNLKKIIEEIIDDIGNAESGGHQNAAGAVIPTEKESTFIEAAKEVLGKYAMEEKIS